MAGARHLEAVLFDFDGTLFDLEVDWADFRRRWAGGDQSGAEILRGLAGRDLAAALEDLAAAEMEGVRRGRPMTGAAEALALVAARFPVAVVSRNSVAAIEGGLAVMGVPTVEVVGRETVREHKPAPDAIQLALKRLGASGGLMVGDTTHDVEAAAAAGIPSVVVRNPKLAFAPQKADYYVGSIGEITKLLEDMKWQRQI